LQLALIASRATRSLLFVLAGRDPCLLAAALLPARRRYHRQTAREAPAMASAQIRSDRHYTYADYLRFPDDERWEIIDGVAYAMAPTLALKHQELLTELVVQVGQQLRGKPCRVFAAPLDVRFARADSADTVVQPDLLVVCDPGKLVDAGVVGAPDWIVEVLSPASASRDQITKRSLYEREGVREYWLVHPIDRLLTIYRLLPGGAFGMPEILELRGRVAVQAVPGIEIDWEPVQETHG
jgi:Uma2 family endonuclease